MIATHNPIENLVRRLHGNQESVLMLYECEPMAVYDVQSVYDYLIEASGAGTLAIAGDYRLNQQVLVREHLKHFTNQQRLVIASQKLLQLLMLESEVQFAKHPGIVLGSIGKYARFFARETALDFPYGPTSIFKDIYDLNAVVLFVGKPRQVDCIKLVASFMKEPIIGKNTSLKDGDVVSYLDYEVSSEALTEFAVRSNRLLSETIGDTVVYGIRYHDLISLVQKQVL